MPRNLKQWETTRALGINRCVFRKGISGWAIPVGTFVTLFEIWQRGFSVANLIVAAIIWPVARYVFGLITWAISERRYLRFCARSKTEA